MSPDDLEKLSVELCRLWPRKFTDDELADWGMRCSRYAVNDVLRALNEFKNTSKFRPQVSEILAKLKGKERRDADESADPGAREGSWADVRRRQNPQWARCNDSEVTLRYWRSLWIRKCCQINAKLMQVPDGEHYQRVRDELNADLSGFRVHVTRGCTMALMGEKGLSQAAAERCVPFVFEERMEMARLMLADVRQMNDVGEPVDAFA